MFGTNTPSRRKVLKTSGAALAGGVAVASMASTASAEEHYDLDEDFEEVQAYYGGSSKDGAYIDVTFKAYRPKRDTGLDRDGVRVGRPIVEIGAEGPKHNYAEIRMDGYDRNNARLLEEDDGRLAIGPYSTIGSSSYEIGFSATGGGSASAGTDTSISVSAAATVSYSESNSESNFEISNYTEPSNELFRNVYDFKKEMREEFVSIGATAAFNCDRVEEYDDAFDFTWEVETTESTVSDTITHQYHEGDLS